MLYICSMTGQSCCFYCSTIEHNKKYPSMRKVACTAKTLRPTPDDATRKAIELLEAAKHAVGEIVEIRRREKLSCTRASHVAREINEIIKVLSLYIPNESLS